MNPIPTSEIRKTWQVKTATCLQAPNQLAATSFTPNCKSPRKQHFNCDETRLPSFPTIIPEGDHIAEEERNSILKLRFSSLSEILSVEERAAMEVSGTVLRQYALFFGAGADTPSFSWGSVSGGSVAVGSDARFYGGVKVLERARRLSGVMGSEFSDDGHLQYYQAALPRCGGGKKKEKGSGVMTSKKKLKLIKGLSKGLNMFSELGFALDQEKLTMLDEVQGQVVTDAAEVLLKQLEQLRAQEKEMKRKRKEEKAKLKASKMKPKCDCESLSSSSSESSDSECGEVVNMNSLRVAVAPPPTSDQLHPPAPAATTLALPPSLATIEDKPCNRTAELCCSTNIDSSFSSRNACFKDESNVVSTETTKKIEVCMGNKCKKSGAVELLQEFERVMGGEGAVVGCKCMGKCRSAPNVRVKNSVADALANDSVKVPANPLFIGVGLEDVNAIVANLLGENHRDMGLASS